MMLSVAHPAIAETKVETFNRLFETATAEKPRFALAAAFAFGDQPPTVRVAGSQSTKSDIAVHADAPWHIGSITKSFTATLIMRLAERGQLDLDTGVGAYLGPHIPEMHTDWQALTLRQLLGHTAGIPANASIFSLMRPEAANRTQGRVDELSRLWNAPIKTHDGSFAYSNIGYVLAGLVAETVTGTSWERLIVEEIGESLELRSLGFGPPTDPNAPWGHGSVLGVARPMNPTGAGSDNPFWMGPAGLMHLSISDLVRWGQAHLEACNGLRPELLSAESCLAMRERGSGNYGLGFLVRPLKEEHGTLVGHAGSNTNWYAVFGIVPERDLVVAIAINSYDGPFIETVFQEILVALLD